MQLLNYKIDWDENKNKQNLEKHGLDFVDFKLSLNESFIVSIDNRKQYNETRYIGYGLIKSIFVVSVFTVRNKHTFRVILFRKGNSRERKIYEQLKNKLE